MNDKNITNDDSDSGVVSVWMTDHEKKLVEKVAAAQGLTPEILLRRKILDYMAFMDDPLVPESAKRAFIDKLKMYDDEDAEGDENHV